jgi:hypothetical protein
VIIYRHLVANPAVMPDHYQWETHNSLVTVSREVHVAETLKKGTRVTGVDRSKLATSLGKRYDSGESIRSLAASTGRSYGFVHRILTETGVTLRGRGGATRSSKTKVRH